jgi:hypothetical protein
MIGTVIFLLILVLNEPATRYCDRNFTANSCTSYSHQNSSLGPSRTHTVVDKQCHLNSELLSVTEHHATKW